MDPRSQPAGATNLWHEYRSAFEHFSEMARSVQKLKEESTPDTGRIEAALLELERARMQYSKRRDALAYSLLLPKREYAAHVKRIAQLLWELEGRRDGRADEHWFRAERIVQSSVLCEPGPCPAAGSQPA